MAARGAACLAVLMLGFPPFPAFAQAPCQRIHVDILNIKNSTGSVACALFESPVGFPADYMRQATNIMSLKIRNTSARCDFVGVAAGTYALAIIHDENMNGKLDTNVLGIPSEGYGFSNDATGIMGAPSFSAASFAYNGENLDLEISLKY